MNRPKIQHYVPQFILRNFTNSQGLLHVFDKWSCKPFASPVNKTAATNHFYDFNFAGEKYSLEPTLANVESIAARHISHIIKRNLIDINDPTERGELACFLSIQMVRTPAHKIMNDEAFSKMESYLRAEGMPEKFFTRDPRRGDNHNENKLLMAQNIMNAPANFGPAFIEKDWVLLITDDDHPFILGDHPLCLHNETTTAVYGHLGLKSEGIEIFFPLTPRLALGLYCPSHRIALQDQLKTVHGHEEAKSFAFKIVKDITNALQNGDCIPSVPENVEFFNSLQISYAERFVFSNKGDFSLAEDMLHSNPNLQHGRRLSEASGKF